MLKSLSVELSGIWAVETVFWRHLCDRFVTGSSPDKTTLKPIDLKIIRTEDAALKTRRVHTPSNHIIAGPSESHEAA